MFVKTYGKGWLLTELTLELIKGIYKLQDEDEFDIGWGSKCLYETINPNADELLQKMNSYDYEEILNYIIAFDIGALRTRYHIYFNSHDIVTVFLFTFLQKLCS